METSSTSAPGEVALVSGSPDNVLATIALPAEKSQAEALAPAIQEILMRTGRKPKDLRAVAVSVGPGSFTGVRIGLATAQGFSLMQRTPILGVSSLGVLALNGRAWAASKGLQALVYPVIDARKGELYGACYRFENGLPVATLRETHARPEDFFERLERDTKNQPILILGDAVTTYASDLLGLRALSHVEIWSDPKTAAATAQGVARLAWPLLDQATDQPAKVITPVYLRPEEKEFRQNP